MGELERRLAAVELLLVEVAPWLATGALDAAATAIGAGLMAGPVSSDEREIRLYALQLLNDGRQRYLPGSVAAWVRDGD